MAKCWLCQKEFINKTALNNHLVSKEHRRQSVVCVFCHTEKTFMKPGDLERHCRTSHFPETKNLSRSFFATGNCLYFAIFPEDYVRTIGKPEPWNSGDAIQARSFMRKHLESQIGGSVKVELVKQGWMRAMKLKNSDGNDDGQMQARIIEASSDVCETAENIKKDKTKSTEKETNKENENEKDKATISQ